MRFPRALTFSSDHVVLLSLLALSLGGNLYQGNLLRSRPATALGAPPFRKGDTLPPLAVLGRSGERTTLAFDEGRPTLLYVFRPSCPWCRRNAASVENLYESLGARYRFLALSLESEGLDTYAGVVPTYVLSGGPAAARFASVPETLLLDPAGTVVDSWSGAYGAETAAALEKYFGTKVLPLELPAASAPGD
jgi:hypothetical protein